MTFRERMVLDSDDRQELSSPAHGPVAHHGARNDATPPGTFRMQLREEVLDVSTRQRPKELQHLRSQLCGAAILMATSMLWASAGPTTKYLFLLPTPPSAALLTACISVATALFLLIGVLGSSFDPSTSNSSALPPSPASAPPGPTETPGCARPVRRRKLWLWKAYRTAAGAAGGPGSATYDVTAEDEAEAEALLHSGVHVTGGGGGAASGAASAAAALFAAQEAERQREAAAAAGGEALGSLHLGRQRESSSDGCGDGVWHIRPSPLFTTSPGCGVRTSVYGEEQELGRLGGGVSDVESSERGGAAAHGVSPVIHAMGSGHARSPPAPAPTPAPYHPDDTDLSDDYHEDSDPCHAPGDPYYDPGDVGRQYPPGYHAIPITDPALAATTPGTGTSGSYSSGGHPGRGSVGMRGSSRRSRWYRLCGGWRLRLLTAPARSLFTAGAELGVYNVMAAALGAWGMQRISATRSAFLAQATALITPLLVAASGGRVSSGVWAACGCGALGGALMALDGARSSDVDAVAPTAYDTMAAGAAAAEAGVGIGEGEGNGKGGLGGAGGLIGGSGLGRRLLDTWLTAGDVMKMEVNGDHVIPGGLVLPEPGGGGGGGGGGEGWSGGQSVVVESTAGAALSTEFNGGSPSAGQGSASSMGLSVATAGAVYVLLSCVFWGLGTVRLGVHSARFRPLHLAAAAAVSYACLSLLWLLWESMASPTVGLSDMLELGLLLRNHVAAALLLWAGLGPGALSSYLQIVGQQTVPPAQAQVLFSSTPLWSALIAQLLLPGEAMGPLAWLGGVVMLAASLMASLWQ